jgi:enoyl-CoA hydratase
VFSPCGLGETRKRLQGGPFARNDKVVWRFPALAHSRRNAHLARIIGEESIMSETVISSVRETEAGSVATLTIDREAKLNALNAGLVETIREAIEREGRAHRVIVLAGAGERSFIGGADIAHMAKLDSAGARSFIEGLHGLCAAIRRAPVPVVARIQGYCFGAGVEIAACCDLRVASHKAQFAMPEVHVGIPSVIEAALLPGLIGAGRARDLVMTGRRIGAEEAWQMGLVERLAAPADLDRVLDETVDMLLQGGPEALRVQKAICNDWDTIPADASIARSIDAFAAMFEGDEPSRMMGAFLNRKRG